MIVRMSLLLGILGFSANAFADDEELNIPVKKVSESQDLRKAPVKKAKKAALNSIDDEEEELVIKIQQAPAKIGPMPKDKITEDTTQNPKKKAPAKKINWDFSDEDELQLGPKKEQKKAKQEKAKKNPELEAIISE